MRKASGKTPKGKKATKVKDLTVKDAKAVKGGLTARKAGKDQQDFLIVKMTDIIVT